jgi:hypothetical protein
VTSHWGLCPHYLETRSICTYDESIAGTPRTGPRLALARHRERGNAAAALVLDKSAASKRFTRALQRLEEILAALPGENREG